MPKIIISLTSFPERLDILPISINSLLNQSVKADKVILWLAPEQFPDKKLPDSILQLRDKGLEIDWYHDIKSYKKLIPALLKYPDDIIVTADDDIVYNENWLEYLIKSHKDDFHYIHSYRARQVKFSESNKLLPYTSWQFLNSSFPPAFTNFPTTGGGVLFPPHCFDSEIFKEDIFTKLCPSADDIWFWAMMLKNNIKIKMANSKYSKISPIPTNSPKLWDINSKPDGNDKQIKNVLTYYNLYDKLYSDFCKGDNRV